MSYIEFNALSVHLGGSFSAKVFAPEMDKLDLDDTQHVKRYPVLWLLHDDGGTALDWLRTPAEQCAIDNGIIIVAPDIGHTLTTNMDYGPEYEKYLCEELQGICRNTFPISEDLSLNWIGGVGTGAYGAAKMAMKYPEVYSKCVLFDGYLDMKKMCDKAIEGQPLGIPHTKASLEAVFGDLTKFEGSKNDIFASASEVDSGEFFITCSKEADNFKEYESFAKLLGDRAKFEPGNQKPHDSILEEQLPKAVDWLCKATL